VLVCCLLFSVLGHLFYIVLVSLCLCVVGVRCRATCVASLAEIDAIMASSLCSGNQHLHCVLYLVVLFVLCVWANWFDFCVCVLFWT
jgi:hypothetical protein